jgi:hypothetical protein
VAARFRLAASKLCHIGLHLSNSQPALPGVGSPFERRPAPALPSHFQYFPAAGLQKFAYLAAHFQADSNQVLCFHASFLAKQASKGVGTCLLQFPCRLDSAMASITEFDSVSQRI